MELAALASKKETLLAEYKTARVEAQEYETVKQNMDALLSVPKEQEQEKESSLYGGWSLPSGMCR